MSNSTHRWQPDYKIKNQKSQKTQPNESNELCKINVKFENSQYFRGSKLPNSRIYKISNDMVLKESLQLSKKESKKKKMASNKLANKVDMISFKTVGTEEMAASNTVSPARDSKKGEKPRNYADLSSLPDLSGSSEEQDNEVRPSAKFMDVEIQKDSSNEEDTSNLIKSAESRVERKLFATEYFVASDHNEFMRSDNIRVYILTNNVDDPSQEVSIAEKIKFTFSPPVWKSFRIIIINKEINVRRQLIRNQISYEGDREYAPVLQTSIPLPSFNSTEADTDDNNKETEEEDVTNTQDTMNEEDEEYFKRISQKFRDSRIIVLPTTKVEATDPIENCFNKLTRLIDDNIFSTNKNIAEASEAISNLQKYWFL